MQKNLYFPMTLIAVAVFSGCSSGPQNSSLAEAHSSYNSARSDPQVMNLAAVELLQAGETLNKADTALNKGESDAAVNQLAHMTKMQVGIAQETAQRKTYELAVTNASTKRDQVRLEARTIEADAANQQVAIMQETADQQAAALAAGRAEAERDQALIAQQEMQLKELNAKKTERGLVMTLGDVLFSTNKAQLELGGMRKMQQLADFLKQYPQHKVLVEGYTDSTGSSSLNQELSDRRANAVRTALVDRGISGNRVATRGYGEAFPIASNDNAARRLLNRRVEIILSNGNGNIAPR
ncbi:OmpA family protein [Sulfuricella sp.]|uniref:OmpA family protein n=1 Tax=Sulfuricella sp. TaxID=2099377 RepID=UPI002CF447CC|nr:OmpA family protein [Sulfuricella sp.]HUX62364.1 OmpA family protein [Sulfuricella sp.]